MRAFLSMSNKYQLTSTDAQMTGPYYCPVSMSAIVAVIILTFKCHQKYIND